MTIYLYNAAGTNSVTLRAPQAGYDVEIHMPIKISKAHDGTYPDNAFFDPPDDSVPPVYGTYDHRLCIINDWKLTAAEKEALNIFLRATDAGTGKRRAVNLILRLGESHTGFFPFGLDYGDTGDFVVRILEQEQGGMLLDPYQWFSDKITLVLVTPPENVVSFDNIVEGEFQIGAVTGLQFPQGGISPKTEYNIQAGLSVNGTPNTLEGPLSASSFETAFELKCNNYHCNQLITQFTSTTRTADISLVAPANFWLYGADNQDDGTYTSKFLGSYNDADEVVLKMMHIGFEQWMMPLNFWMESRVS